MQDLLDKTAMAVLHRRLVQFRSHQDTQSSQRRILTEILFGVIEIYRQRMCPVWPIVNVEALKEQLLDDDASNDSYILATSLCAATMAQLQLPPIISSEDEILTEDIENECIRARSLTDFRTRPNIYHVLSAFFLHVYHAKINEQSAALLYIQEAISLARILSLDRDDIAHDQTSIRLSNNPNILHLLLWVSERGYAIQHALPISLQQTIAIPSLDIREQDHCVQGLINLAELFIAFDSSFVPQFSRYGRYPVSASQLMSVDDGISDVYPLSFQPSTQKADFLVTKGWMRILLWQQALSCGLLSTVSVKQSLTFHFPALIARDLLQSMVAFSADQILPLGRDQLVKLFEVTNTLADVILCNPQLNCRENRKLGPPDFLRGLYEAISPIMEADAFFNSMLREKTAEVLLKAPTRMWTLDPGDGDDDERTPRVHGLQDMEGDKLIPYDGGATEKEVLKVKDMVLSNSLAGFKDGVNALYVYDLRPGMKTCKVPGGFVAGGADGGGVLAKKMTEFGAENGRKCVVLEGLGHLPMVERPGECAEVVEGFLRG